MLTLDFINVGYGDAILLRQGSFSMLIDCGDISVGKSRSDGERILAADYLKSQGITELDILVITHLHLDHVGGLMHILPDIQIKELWTNYYPPDIYHSCRLKEYEDYSSGAACLVNAMNIYLDALCNLKNQGTKIRVIQGGHFENDLAHQLKCRIFSESYAIHDVQNKIWEKVLRGEAAGIELDILDRFINNTSIRLSITYDGQNIELPGDTYGVCWGKHSLSKCSIVKLPHHGHADSLTPELLEMLKPEFAVISVSDSRKDDCPSGKILDMLSSFGCRILFTDSVNCQKPHAAIRLILDHGITQIKV